MEAEGAFVGDLLLDSARAEAGGGGGYEKMADGGWRGGGDSQTSAPFIPLSPPIIQCSGKFLPVCRTFLVLDDDHSSTLSHAQAGDLDATVLERNGEELRGGVDECEVCGDYDGRDGSEILRGERMIWQIVTWEWDNRSGRVSGTGEI